MMIMLNVSTVLFYADTRSLQDECHSPDILKLVEGTQYC